LLLLHLLLTKTSVSGICLIPSLLHHVLESQLLDISQLLRSPLLPFPSLPFPSLPVAGAHTCENSKGNTKPYRGNRKGAICCVSRTIKSKKKIFRRLYRNLFDTASS
jgi:hypothetical protein